MARVEINLKGVSFSPLTKKARISKNKVNKIELQIFLKNASFNSIFDPEPVLELSLFPQPFVFLRRPSLELHILLCVRLAPVFVRQFLKLFRDLIQILVDVFDTPLSDDALPL